MRALPFEIKTKRGQRRVLAIALAVLSMSCVAPARAADAITFTDITATTIEQVLIRWTNGITQVVDAPAIDQFVTNTQSIWVILTATGSSGSMTLTSCWSTGTPARHPRHWPPCPSPQRSDCLVPLSRSCFADRGDLLGGA